MLYSDSGLLLLLLLPDADAQVQEDGCLIAKNVLLGRECQTPAGGHYCMLYVGVRGAEIVVAGTANGKARHRGTHPAQVAGSQLCRYGRPGTHNSKHCRARSGTGRKSCRRAKGRASTGTRTRASERERVSA